MFSPDVRFADDSQVKGDANGWETSGLWAGNSSPEPSALLLNQRYKGPGADSRDETCAAHEDPRLLGRVSGSGSASFAFPADLSVLRVFQNYTTVRELISDAIRGRKIPPRARRLAFLHQFFDLGIAQSGFIAAESQRFQLLGVVVFQHRKHSIEAGQKRFRGGHVALTKFALIHGD